MAKKIIHACSIKKAIKVTEDAVFFFVLKLPYTYVHFFFVKWEMWKLQEADSVHWRKIERMKITVNQNWELHWDIL